MKKNAIMIPVLCAAVCAVLFAGAAPVSALGMSAGASVMYTTFEMTPTPGEDVNPGLMYGPVLGLDWGKSWSITSVLLTGNFKHNVSESIGDDYNERRYDSDTTLNYSINRWLKVFGGFKYSRFDAHLSSGADDGKYLKPFEGGNSKYISYGPGGGIGVTLPLADSLFAVGNVSLMYLYGRTSEPAGMGYENVNYTDAGFNASLALAYYIDAYATTLSLGGRYQQYTEKYSDSDYKVRFLGVTVSAIRHFGLGREE
jgi:hypothetical protein